MSKLKIHTVDQPESDTTTFVLSCNRLEVLDKTLQSFYATRDYVTKMVIVDDSAVPGVFETLVERYGHDCDVVCFPRNRSQWWAMDFMVSYCDSEYIFYLEDDWELLQPGYLDQSKTILQKYREVGTVDISWRTFEWQGIDSYDKELVDDMFYWKKLWLISDYHLHWYGWVGSPNLKRRDDLILLGRVEKWHNEWNIDRKFLGKGFKAVFLNGEYARHLGDNCSAMADKRPNDATTPEDYYPKELLEDRTYPAFDYRQYDSHLRSTNDISIVTTLIDIDRSDRNFIDHYIGGLTKLMKSRHPIILFGESKYFDKIKELRGGAPITLIPFEKSDMERYGFFQPTQNIITQEEWVNQSEWMKDSVIRSTHYIPLTLMKQHFLQDALQYNNSSYYYWVDAGMFSSYGVDSDINDYYFTKIPKEKFFITSFPYFTNSEIHGFNIDTMTELCGQKPNYVCRATLYGGTPKQIQKITELFYDMVNQALSKGAIGTEEAIYTLLSIKHRDQFIRSEMPNGDIKNYLVKLTQRGY